MKRTVQLLIWALCMVPLFAGAEEETMEQRKERIRRKYLRERIDITYSDQVVPGSEEGEYEDPLGLEPLAREEMEFKRQGGAVPPPVYIPPPQQTPNRNWLLDDPEEEAALYPDPYAQEDAEETAPPSFWTPQLEQDDSYSVFGNRRRDGFNQNEQDADPYAPRDDRTRGMERSGPYGQYVPYGNQRVPGIQQDATAPYRYGSGSTYYPEQRGYYPPQSEQRSYGQRSYNQNPYGQRTESWRDATPRSSGNDAQIYPYGSMGRSPYSSRSEDTRRNGQNRTPFGTRSPAMQGPQQQNGPTEYQREDPFSQWNRKQEAEQQDPFQDPFLLR